MKYLIFLVAFFMFVGTANADLTTDMPYTNSVTIRDSLAIAQTFWGGIPPQGCMDKGFQYPQVYIATQADLDAQYYQDDGTLEPFHPPGSVLARSKQPGCSIWLPVQSFKTPFSRVHICDTLVHESGHSYGYPHTDNQKSIMYPVIGNTVVGSCFKRFWKGTRRQWMDKYGVIEWSSR